MSFFFLWGVYTSDVFDLMCEFIFFPNNESSNRRFFCSGKIWISNVARSSKFQKKVCYVWASNRTFGKRENFAPAGKKKDPKNKTQGKYRKKDAKPLCRIFMFFVQALVARLFFFGAGFGAWSVLEFQAQLSHLVDVTDS